MKKLYALLSLLLFFGYANAQTSGYQGKRWLISADLNGMVMLTGHPNHNYWSGKKLRFSTHYDLELDYCINRRTTFGFMLQRVATSEFYTYEDVYKVSGVINYVGNDYDFLKIRGITYGVDFKFFGSNANADLAPVGSYVKLGLGLIAYNYMPYNSETTALNESYKISKTASLITLSYGKQRIIFNNIMLRASFQLGVVPTGLGVVFKSDEDDYTQGYDNTYASSNDEVLRRLSRYYAVNFNFGIGFLIPYRSK